MGIGGLDAAAGLLLDPFAGSHNSAGGVRFPRPKSRVDAGAGKIALSEINTDLRDFPPSYAAMADTSGVKHGIKDIGNSDGTFPRPAGGTSDMPVQDRADPNPPPRADTQSSDSKNAEGLTHQ
jgi:hypothetical protein